MSAASFRQWQSRAKRQTAPRHQTRTFAQKGRARCVRRRTLFAVTAIATAAATAAIAPATSADWPSEKPIRLIVASGAGGNADVVARIVAAELEPLLDQRILVENLAAASDMQATQAVSEADPDGYTLLVGTSSQLVHNIALFEPLPVDIRARLRGVALMNEVPMVMVMVMVVNNDDAATDLDAMITAIKDDPDAFQNGSGPTGTTTHITGALFLDRIDSDVLHQPYPKSGKAMRDLIGGRISYTFNPSLTAVPQVRDGAVRPLGVSAPARLSAIPDVPTMSEAGRDGFVSQTWNSIAAPVDTPDGIVNSINELVHQVVQSDEIKTRLTDLGSLVPDQLTPAEVDEYYDLQRDAWIPVVRATGARREVK